VSNEWFLGDEALQRRFRVINAETPCWLQEKEILEVKEEPPEEGNEEVVTISSDEEG
jgi:hypothetical protein